ncbi:Uncharacterised protein [Bordetella pertussis]|nr:Uncharacterised protein [Bordetella pertussis]CFP65174.1 Uncharacterised protein [Bordetella pertussis]
MRSDTGTSTVRTARPSGRSGSNSILISLEPMRRLTMG